MAKIQAEKKRKEESELDGCTFKPVINKEQPLALNQSIVTDRHQRSSVHEYLFKKASVKTSPRDINEIEYEKQKNECTFKPNVKSPARPNSALNTSKQSTKAKPIASNKSFLCIMKEANKEANNSDSIDLTCD